jgi:hypothetical protein
VADRQLLGHAHSAVQLHRLLTDESGRPADRRLRGRYRPGAGSRLRLEVEHGEIHCGHGLLEFQVHVDHPVLQHLEAADRLPELLALFAVFKRVGQHLSHTAHRFRTDRGRALVAGLGERRPRVTLLAQQRTRGQPQPVEHKVGCPPVVYRPVTVDLDSR